MERQAGDVVLVCRRVFKNARSYGKNTARIVAPLHAPGFKGRLFALIVAHAAHVHHRFWRANYVYMVGRAMVVGARKIV